jgi:hypothetical protein
MDVGDATGRSADVDPHVATGYQEARQSLVNAPGTPEQPGSRMARPVNRGPQQNERGRTSQRHRLLGSRLSAWLAPEAVDELGERQS